MDYWFKFDPEKLQKELEQKEAKEFSGLMYEWFDWEDPDKKKECDRGLGIR